MEKVILLRYGELHLKGKNRPFFEKALIESIKSALIDFKNIKILKADGRIYVTQQTEKAEIYDSEWERTVKDIMSRLEKVFGLVSISIAYKVKKDMETIEVCAEYALGEFIRENTSCKSFKMQSKRSDKNFCLNSVELNMSLGDYLLDKFPKIYVDVHNPDVTVYLEVREHAYIYTGITPAAGGMPKATNGKAILLLSGGIDSPVAGYMVAKRGVEIIAVHFYSFPYTGEQSKQKVLDLSQILSQYCGPLKLYIVPFTQIQQEIYDECPQNYLTIIMRRFMMEIAQRIAFKEGAKALVTGESIGQVASQTIDSLLVTDDAVTLPVFRPLIGMDKVEIMDRARRIGSYETSIRPYEDCCTVFTPKNPVIYPIVQKAREAAALLESNKLIDEAVSGAEVMVM